MKKKQLILVYACFLASCASIPSSVLVRDRFGILEVDISSDYFDDTKSYLQDIQTVSLKRGKPFRPGIKPLLKIRRSDGTASCKFFELRHSEYDVGYKWDIERLATEISISSNKAFTNYEMRDYMQLGLAAPMVGNSTKQTELVSSTNVTINIYDGWQKTYRYTMVQDGRMQRREVALSKTIVVKAPPADAFDMQKKYIVADCMAGAANSEKATVVMDRITALMNSMRILTDFPKS